MTEITNLDPYLLHAYSMEIFSLPWGPVLSPLEGFKTVTTLEKKNYIAKNEWYSYRVLILFEIFFLSRYDKLRETERTSEGFVPRKMCCELVWANSFRKRKMGVFGIGELFQFTSRL